MVRLKKLMFTVRCVTLCIVLTHLLLVSGQTESSRNSTSSTNQSNRNRGSTNSRTNRTTTTTTTTTTTLTDGSTTVPSDAIAIDLASTIATAITANTDTRELATETGVTTKITNDSSTSTKPTDTSTGTVPTTTTTRTLTDGSTAVPSDATAIDLASTIATNITANTDTRELATETGVTTKITNDSSTSTKPTDTSTGTVPTATSTTESTASSTESTASSTESTASSTVSTASSTESTASSTESTASSTESTASRTESTASSTESASSSTESPASSTESPASSTESTASSTESTTSTTEPTTSTTQSTTSTTEPTTTLPDCSGKTVEDFKVLDAGTESLLLQWRDPTDCGPYSIKSYEISLIPESDTTELVTLSVPATCVNATGDHRMILLNNSTCGNASLDAKLSSCTSYALTVKVDYGSLSGGSVGIPAFTLPSAEESRVLNLQFDEVNATSFKFSWDPPRCNYNIVAYNVTLKDPVKEVTVPEMISRSQFVIAGDFGGIKIDPCVTYQVKMTPIFLNSTPGNAGEFITATTRSQNVSFLNMDHTSTDRTVALTWILQAPKSCQGKITLYNLTYSIDNMDSSRTVNASCSSSGSCSYTITDLLPCSQYSVRIVPAEKPFDGLPENTSSVFTQPGEFGALTAFSISNTEDTSIDLKWTVTQNCSRAFRTVYLNITPEDSPGYEFKVNKNCISNGSSMTITNSTNCIFPRYVQITPCTYYTVQVIPVYFGRFNGSSSSDSTTTKPGLLGEVRNLSVTDVGSDSFWLQWQLEKKCFRKFTSVLVTVTSRNNQSWEEPRNISRNCTETDNGTSTVRFSVSPNGSLNQGCSDTGFKVSACGNYSVAVLPVFADLYNGTQGQVDTRTKPGNDGNIVNISSVTGETWLKISWTIPSNQCADALSGIKLQISAQDSNPSNATWKPRNDLEISKNYFSLNSSRLNETITPCTLYNIKITPEFFSSYEGNLATHDTKTEPGDGTKVLDLITENRGQTWLGLRWIAPACRNTAKLLYYKITVQELWGNYSTVTVNANLSCFNKSSDLVSFNLTENYCGPESQPLKIQSCAPYSVSVTPVFNLSFPETPTENRSFTLPSENDTAVQLDAANVSSFSFQLAWKKPQCRLSVEKWAVTIAGPAGSPSINIQCPRDSLLSSSGSFLLDVTDKVECDNQLKDISVRACSAYVARVQPVITQLVNLTPDKVPVQTKFAPPGEVRNLKLTGREEKSLTFQWSPPEKNPECVSQYKVRLKKDANELQSAATSATNCRFYDLLPCTEYGVSVEIIPHSSSRRNPYQPSAAESKAKTSMIAPGIPLNLTGVFQQDSTMNVSWKNPEENLQCVEGYKITISSSYPTLFNITSLPAAETAIVYEVQGGSSYNVTLQAFANETGGEPLYSGAAEKILVVPSPVDGASIAIIVTIVVLVVAIVAVLGYMAFKRKLQLMKLGKLASDRPSSTTESSLELTPVCSRPMKLASFIRECSELLMDGGIDVTDEYDRLLQVVGTKRYPRTAAENPANKEKNRYINILPFDHSRVRLSAITGIPHSDYINASFVKDLRGSRRYIAAQGPKDSTIGDFWRMIWEREVNIIVMLTGLVEQGKVKCAEYWPDSDCTSMYGNITVSTEDEQVFDKYTRRSFHIRNQRGEIRVVVQLHFTQWPDFGCPHNPEDLIGFIEVVRAITQNVASRSPTVVHCSAGVGRTGTYIAVDLLTQEAEANNQIDIFDTVYRLRNDRSNMVQTEDQYVFVYQCMLHYVKTRLA